MQCMFMTEFAIFIHFQPIRIILFVFIGLIIALFANCTGQSNCITHFMHSLSKYNLNQYNKFLECCLIKTTQLYRLSHSSINFTIIKRQLSIKKRFYFLLIYIYVNNINKTPISGVMLNVLVAAHGFEPWTLRV